MPRHSELTDKQARFVEEYLTDLNATQAALRAGYSADTAGQIGHENLKKPDIQAAIAQGKAELSANTGVTKAWVVEQAQTLFKLSLKDRAYAAARGSLELLARLHGHIVEPPRTVRLIGGWEDLSDEEVAVLAQGDRGAVGTRH